MDEFKTNLSISLYGLNHYLLEFIKLYENKKLPNKILLSGDKGLGKSTLAYHLSNFVLSRDEEFKYDLKSLILIKKTNHLNL